MPEPFTAGSVPVEISAFGRRVIVPPGSSHPRVTGFGALAPPQQAAEGEMTVTYGSAGSEQFAPATPFSPGVQPGVYGTGFHAVTAEPSGRNRVTWVR